MEAKSPRKRTNEEKILNTIHLIITSFRGQNKEKNLRHETVPNKKISTDISAKMQVSKHMEIRSTLSAIREMKIKTRINCFPPTRRAAIRKTDNKKYR